jgi:hypothetical protein
VASSLPWPLGPREPRVSHTLTRRHSGPVRLCFETAASFSPPTTSFAVRLTCASKAIPATGGASRGKWKILVGRLEVAGAEKNPPPDLPHFLPPTRPYPKWFAVEITSGGRPRSTSALGKNEMAPRTGSAADRRQSRARHRQTAPHGRHRAADDRPRRAADGQGRANDWPRHADGRPSRAGDRHAHAGDWHRRADGRQGRADDRPSRAWSPPGVSTPPPRYPNSS